MILLANAKVTVNEGDLRCTQLLGFPTSSACLVTFESALKVSSSPEYFGRIVKMNGVSIKQILAVKVSSVQAPAVARDLIRAITFKTVGGAAGERKVVFTLSDGDGGLSNDATKVVNVS